MPNEPVAFVLTSAEAHALFDAAALGLSKQAESRIAGNDKVADALQKIERQMRLMFKMKAHISGNGAA
jgi:hypothetical protein